MTERQARLVLLQIVRLADDLRPVRRLVEKAIVDELRQLASRLANPLDSGEFLLSSGVVLRWSQRRIWIEDDTNLHGTFVARANNMLRELGKRRE